MRITRTCRLSFSAAHRIACPGAQLHGHTYVAEITSIATDIDGEGSGSLVAEEVGRWLAETWDHACLVWEQDHAVLSALDVFEQASGERPRVVRLPISPTAENLAAIIFGEADIRLHPFGVQVERVRLWDTASSYADAERER